MNTPGIRRPDGTDPMDLKPCEYALTEDHTAAFIVNPAGDLAHVPNKQPDGWAITVHDDETCSINPSIWWSKNADPPGWHGYLTNGEWVQV